jgi:hypothetical protein
VKSAKNDFVELKENFKHSFWEVEKAPSMKETIMFHKFFWSLAGY